MNSDLHKRGIKEYTFGKMLKNLWVPIILILVAAVGLSVSIAFIVSILLGEVKP